MSTAGLLRALGACLLTVWSLAPIPALSAPGLFGEDEILQTTGMERFDKWNDMLARFLAQQPKSDKKPCQTDLMPIAGTPRPLDFCKLAPWREFVQVTKRQTMSPDVLTEVNRFLNKFPYVEDVVNFGVRDYWETPSEIMNFSGDCEDFAIAKYYTLKAMGVDPNSMRVVAVLDLNLNLGHAVLMVRLNNENYILDNQADGAIPASRVKHYQAVYSINEGQWWKHIQGLPKLTR
jgi:predicted transglutaminase-like cysteine proteinase